MRGQGMAEGSVLKKVFNNVGNFTYRWCMVFSISIGAISGLFGGGGHCPSVVERVSIESYLPCFSAGRECLKTQWMPPR
jgi:hypothetical protein